MEIWLKKHSDNVPAFLRGPKPDFFGIFECWQRLKEKSVPYTKLLYRGFYPRIIDKKLNPSKALSFYISTYIQRDLRDIKEIKNLRQFELFVKLCASFASRTINKSLMGNNIGIDSKTTDSWLSILSASYIIFLLPPHFKNFRKRLARQPKLYFCDVGLASFLLGIRKESHIVSHPLKGALFENLVIIEKLKQQLNKAEDPSLYYFRDSKGNEVDLLEDKGDQIISYGIKSGQTLTRQLFKGLDFYKKLNRENKKSVLVYTGKEQTARYGHKCIPYNQL